jgi:hypothetical protein
MNTPNAMQGLDACVLHAPEQRGNGQQEDLLVEGAVQRLQERRARGRRGVATGCPRTALLAVVALKGACDVCSAYRWKMLPWRGSPAAV